MANEDIVGRLNRPLAKGWRPEPGDVIAGTVVDVDMTEGSYGPYPVVTVDTGGGEEVALHAFHAVLRSELAKRKPQVGDRIGVRYDGKPEGRSYVLYRVRVVKPGRSDTGPDWEAIGQNAGFELGDDEEIGEDPF